MNIAALKEFAPAVRRQLMEAVNLKLSYVLTARTPDFLDTYARQVAALRKLADEDRTGLVERVAYTWFNRLTALRFLDAREWHPFGVRVLTPATAGETQPELLKVIRSGTCPDDLRRYADINRLNGLLDGRIPSPSPQSEVYRHLVLATCRFYNALLPDLFERLDDETELLLPDDLLTEQSVAHGFRTRITDEDCSEVEIIGWLYQFYISERKDEVMARKSAVPKEDIPAVTQLFTPHWIVRYLIENSLGRLWLSNRPDSRLRERMPYYIEVEPEADFLKITRPEEIRVLDPACGSGHMLTYAFDLLYAIYEEEGYGAGDIPGLILEHNLYGLEICPRAAQLSELAMLFKAREKSRLFFQREYLIQPKVMELREVRFAENELREYIHALDLGELFNESLLRLMHQFEDAKNFGSLIRPCTDEQTIAFVQGAVEEKDLGNQLFLYETHRKVLRVLGQAENLAQKYHVLVANPPYMGSVSFNPALKTFVKTLTEEGRTDLFAVFILRLAQLARDGGYVSMITMQSWLFLSSYESLRKQVLLEWSPAHLIHLGPHAFDSLGGEVVQTASFVIKKKARAFESCIFVRVVDGRGEAEKQAALLGAIADEGSALRYRLAVNDLLKIPGSPFAYWLTAELISCFSSTTTLGDTVVFKQGLATSDNERFLRYWQEISQAKVDYSCKNLEELSHSSRKWFPYNKGGSYRKWYGNNDYLVNWENDGEEMKEFTATLPQGTWVRLKSREFYCLPTITYSALSGGDFGARKSDAGFLFDTKGSCIFGSAIQLSNYCGLLNSKPAKAFLDVLCPTLDYSMVGIKQVPLPPDHQDLNVKDTVDACCALARADWDNFESSWDFGAHPLVRSCLKGVTLELSWRKWEAQCASAIRRMQELETENNRVFINAYGLQHELSPEVPEDQITLARADARRDMTAFLSYIVGCMMGRYSLDKPGLILADAGDTVDAYLAKVGKPIRELTFAPDEDGIIPVLDGEWFEDDVVGRTREFLRSSFGEASLRENVRFIEDSLSKDLRKYFLTDFYKDHLQAYKKRPIYWMVQSPKKGFNALIYLHRYTRDTMNLVLNRYLREYEAKLRSRISHLDGVQASAAVSARDKSAARKEFNKLTSILHECEEWERQVLLPLAQARIELDLDDGVKVNYLKLGEALAPIPGLAAAED